MADKYAITHRKGRWKAQLAFTSTKTNLRDTENCSCGKRTGRGGIEVSRRLVFEPGAKPSVICFKCDKLGHSATHYLDRIKSKIDWLTMNKPQDAICVGKVNNTYKFFMAIGQVSKLEGRR